MAYIISNTNVTLFHNGKAYSATNTHPKFSEIIAAIRNNELDAAIGFIDRGVGLKSFVLTPSSDLELRNGAIYYEGHPLHNSLVERILKMYDEGFDINPIMAFLKNLMKNPSNRAIQELYTFLEVGQLPITEDGHFLAYKRIRDDYTDVHSGTIDNHPGQTVSMPRRLVDDDARNVCSHGLHFASLDYLKHFCGSRLVVLKINPADVVSIPNDYNFTKGRTWRYVVQLEIDLPSDFTTWTGYFSSSVWIPEGDEQELDEEDYEEEYEEEDVEEDGYENESDEYNLAKDYTDEENAILALAMG
jgi:hypothetical protein